MQNSVVSIGYKQAHGKTIKKRQITSCNLIGKMLPEKNFFNAFTKCMFVRLFELQ